MARVLSHGKIISAILSDGVVLSRRHFSAAAATAGRLTAVEEKAGPPASDMGAKAWLPDPVTGYYGPENRLREMDPAEMRQMLVKKGA